MHLDISLRGQMPWLALQPPLRMWHVVYPVLHPTMPRGHNQTLRTHHPLTLHTTVPRTTILHQSHHVLLHTFMRLRPAAASSPHRTTRMLHPRTMMDKDKATSTVYPRTPYVVIG